MTGRRIVLTETALSSLEDIVDWTVETFGPAQAIAYRGVIEQRLAAADRGTAHLRSLTLWTGDRRHAAISCLAAGAHLLLLKISNEEILVLDILHSRADLGRHLPGDDLPK